MTTTGEVEPQGEGEWLTLEEAGARLGIDRKAVYRRIQRGRMTGKKAPFASHLLVWFPLEERGSPEADDSEEEQRSLSVPEAQERFLDVIEGAISRAVEPLNVTIAEQQRRIEELARENERLGLERERRSQEQEREQQERTNLEAERDSLREQLDAERQARAAAEQARRWKWWPF